LGIWPAKKSGLLVATLAMSEAARALIDPALVVWTATAMARCIASSCARVSAHSWNRWCLLSLSAAPHSGQVRSRVFPSIRTSARAGVCSVASFA
jgi:hypothetical protein